jgi:hypothetical protein
MDLVAWLRRELPPSVKAPISRVAKRVLRFKYPTLAFIYRRDLSRLATLFGTDKWGSHWYTQHYERYFAPMRRSRINLLEIGIGGYKDSTKGAESLRMWKAYFRSGRIVGIDIQDKRHFAEKRIDARQCDQTDAAKLTELSEEYGGFDIIVDDGSHLNHHVIQTFQVLFPLLREGGFYAVEDVQTSYWPSWGGGLRASGTSMEFFKALTDGLNHVEFPIPGYEPTYFDQNIMEIAFFHNLIIVRKCRSGEKTNAPELVEREIAETTRV